MKDYFPARLIKTAELDASRNYISGYHPHGVISIGAFLNFVTEATGFSKIFPNIKPYLLTLDVNFKLPIHRDILLSGGCSSVSKESINWLLNNEGTGNMVVIVIGGAKEAIDCHPGFVRLTLRNRKGFVKIAIQNGASLLPIFGFGENELFKQVNNPEGSLLRTFQLKFQKIFGFSPLLYYGRGINQYTFGLLPFRKPIDVIVGKPIEIERNPNPSQEVIDHYHQLYMDSLQKLFDNHKKDYELYNNVTMEFV